MERRNGARPTEVHLDAIGAIRQMIEDAMASAMPRFGTVAGTEGGKIRVQFDDEDSPRTVGIPRVRGQRYEQGQRVLLIGTGGGEFTIAGGVAATDTKSALQAVGDDEVVDGSLSGSKLRPSHVRGTNPVTETNKLITERSIETNPIGSGNATDGNLSTVGGVKSYAAQKSHAHNTGDLPSDVVYTSALNDYATKSAIAKMVTQTSINTDIKSYTDEGNVLDSGSNSQKKLVTIAGLLNMAPNIKKGTKLPVKTDSDGKMYVEM